MTVVLSVQVKSEHLEALYRAAGNRAPVALARAINRTGVPAANKYRRAAIKTLGAKNHPLAKLRLSDWSKRQTRLKKANPGKLSLEFTTWGKPLPLIYFSPIEKPAGTTVRWLGERRMFPRAFYLSGSFKSGRKPSRLSHSVWQRVGAGRWNLSRPKGPSLADAAVKPSVLSVWRGEAEAKLPARLAHEVVAILKGYAPAEFRTLAGMKGVL